MTRPPRPKPAIREHLCKGCGRCVDACPEHCITPGHDTNQESGLIPVHIDLEACNGCGICFAACPEPFGLGTEDVALQDPRHLFGNRERETTPAPAVPSVEIALPECEPLVLKGNDAAAIGALLAGCRHVFGYPITPSTEGAELLARVLPLLHGVFLQAVSETATVNHLYGCGGAGLPCLTFTSSPGFSLMLEGISYMIGAEIPAVFVNVMRGGPGLGNIGPEQADIKLLCRGLGHGNTHAVVLAPATPQEMLDLTRDAFRIAFEYRNPVMVAADGYLGQMTGKVQLPATMTRPGLPDWGVWGDAGHRHNLHTSIYLAEPDLERHNEHLEEKYRSMIDREQRAHLFRTEDASVLVMACNTPARMAKGAVAVLRDEGIAAGLFHPVTLWPFPIRHLQPLLGHVTDIVVVEASSGQLQDELRLALSRAGTNRGANGRPALDVRIHSVQRMGGMLPLEREITDAVRAIARRVA
jgi:pyruvate/2-oxoacid:ferredoxin oxidoreductase alpha subunit/NAD-dependent dihydropyrimidine dehydrogenase PreA subunit